MRLLLLCSCKNDDTSDDFFFFVRGSCDFCPTYYLLAIFDCIHTPPVSLLSLYIVKSQALWSVLPYFNSSVTQKPQRDYLCTRTCP